MPTRFEPDFTVLPPAQREIWPALEEAAEQQFYGGTAVALQLGHRPSLDFDFFRKPALDKAGLINVLRVLDGADILQEAPNTFVVSVRMPSGPVKLSFFGHIRFGRLRDPLLTSDGVLRVASLDDLLATKLKAMLDRAEAKDYVDAAAMIDAGVSLPGAIAAAKAMFGAEPRTILNALGYFEDGDVPTLPPAARRTLLAACNAVRDLPEISLLED
jgi:hypothetical protein